MKDAYRGIAGNYDRLFERINRGLRLAGIFMARPAKGMDVLDIGCGTGTQLELYQRYGCNLHGIDRSPAMLQVARKRLGDAARLHLGDATRMPYGDRTFDLAVCMLALHEMSPGIRSGVLSEAKRVLKDNGRILLIDFHPGPYLGLRGWISKLLVFSVELAAGGEHFKHYRQFMAAKGLPALAAQHGLELKKQSILAEGNFAVCLFSQGAQVMDA